MKINENENPIYHNLQEITVNTMEIQEIIRDYGKNLYSNKFENLGEIGNF
jgi:hypothetical protein